MNDRRDPEYKLGEILLLDNLINQDQLDRALQLQAQTGGLLGELLVKLGYASEETVVMGLSKQLGVPSVGTDEMHPKWDARLFQIINETFCRTNGMMPLRVEDKTLMVAMSDPRNMMLRENLRLMTGYDIQPMIATKAQIFKAIDQVFAGGNTNLIAKSLDRRRVSELGDDVLTAADMVADRVDLDQAVLTKGKQANVVGYVNAVLKQAITERASDIHFEPYPHRVALRFRIDGDLFDRMPPSKDIYPAIVSRIKILSRLDISERRLPQDGAIAVKLQNRAIDFRVSVCPTTCGESLVLRILDRGTETLDINRLGLEARQENDFIAAVTRPHGLILLTGPTGSGKTTTLYAVLNKIKSPRIKIVTAEDPVEYKIEGICQLQVQSAIGLTFSNALRSFLRHDPDVILVGEVRDPETAQICIRAALTGHLVISTLHTNCALEAVKRLTDMNVDPFLLAPSLCLTAAQRLLRVLCPACKRPYRPDERLLEAIIHESGIDPTMERDKVVLHKEIGCGKCAFTGFMGRKAIFEIVPVGPEMATLIYRNQSDLSLMREEARRQGIITLRAHGWQKVLQGISTVEEVLSATVAD